MNHLKNTRIYLSGPIEFSQNPISWRQKISSKLKEIGIIIYDPLIKPDWLPKLDQKEQLKLKELYLQNQHIPIVESNNKLIREYCLNLVRHADILIVKLDKTFTAGTLEEIKLAEGKPIFIITENVSMWLVDQLNLYDIDRRNMYLHSTEDSCINTLCQINISMHGLNINKCEWIFINNESGDTHVPSNN